MEEFNNSCKGSERMFVFIFIRLKIEFCKKVGVSPRDFFNGNIWIYQITKPCKLIKKLPNNSNINPMFSYQNSCSSMGPKIIFSKKVILFLIDIEEIFPMLSYQNSQNCCILEIIWNKKYFNQILKKNFT